MIVMAFWRWLMGHFTIIRWLFTGRCSWACEYTKPYGFVPEAGCPVHDPDYITHIWAAWLVKRLEYWGRRNMPKKIGEIPDFFSWAYNGLEMSKSFRQALEAGGVEIESCSYSDTRLEWDLVLEYKGKRFRGHVGTSFEFSRMGASPYSETMGHYYSAAYYGDPPTLETALYRVFCALNGERIDGDHVVGDTIIRWMC